MRQFGASGNLPVYEIVWQTTEDWRMQYNLYDVMPAYSELLEDFVVKLFYSAIYHFDNLAQEYFQEFKFRVW